jgi:hypothetical protein
MKHLTYLLALCLVCIFQLNNANAQATYSQEVNGSPMKASRYLNINGSPYLFDSWLPAIVELENGQSYKLDVKYDLVAENLLFKDKKGDSLTFMLPVKAFKFNLLPNNETSYTFKSGFPPTSSITNKETLYQVLYEGSLTLLKKTTKSIWEETTTYGTANRVKNISAKTFYYVYDGISIKPVKNQKKAVLAAFGSKSAQVETFVKESHLDVSKDDDLVKVFTFFNALK